MIADTSRSDGGRTLASPDVAMCAECAAEQRDPADRRYRHAFVNCTNCGPRFTIIASLPYDRANTTMAAFRCARTARANTTIPPTAGSTRSRCAARTAVRHCATGPATARRRGRVRADAAPEQLLRDGGILAVKGIGGYHLACDAGNEDAVAELRHRKRRGDKPFAVMVPDLDTAHGIADIDDDLGATAVRPAAAHRAGAAAAVPHP